MIKIAVIGAESTGKTGFCMALALRLRAHGYWAQALPESLRLFCDRFGRVPKQEDQALILTSQLRAEAAALQARPSFLICDSTPLVTAFYSQWYFQDESLIASALNHHRGYALTFMTDLSLPWQADGIQRESPQIREKVDKDLRAFLGKHQVPVQALYLGNHASGTDLQAVSSVAEQVLSL